MKSRTFKIASLLLVLFLALALVTGCGGGSQDGPAGTEAGAEAGDGPKIVCKVAHATATDHPYHTGLMKFDELLRERSNGRISLEIFPSAQLGSERETIEGVQMGTIDMTLVSTAPLSGFSDSFLLVDLPFIFTSREHAYEVLDGEIGQKMFADLEGKGIKGLVYFENGFRNITNSIKPIVHPEDLKGIKIRTMENPIHIDSFRAIGANPTPIAFGELFTALQQKTVDAQENPLALIYASKFHEVQDYLSLTGHFYAPASLLMSEELWNSLSAEDQALIMECAHEAKDWQREQVRAMDEEVLESFKEGGMIVSEVDPLEWQKAMESVYEQWQDKIGKELIDQVKALSR